MMTTIFNANITTLVKLSANNDVKPSGMLITAKIIATHHAHVLRFQRKYATIRYAIPIPIKIKAINISIAPTYPLTSLGKIEPSNAPKKRENKAPSSVNAPLITRRTVARVMPHGFFFAMKQ